MGKLVFFLITICAFEAVYCAGESSIKMDAENHVAATTDMVKYQLKTDIELSLTSVTQLVVDVLNLVGKLLLAIEHWLEKVSVLEKLLGPAARLLKGLNPLKGILASVKTQLDNLITMLGFVLSGVINSVGWLLDNLALNVGNLLRGIAYIILNLNPDRKHCENGIESDISKSVDNLRSTLIKCVNRLTTSLNLSLAKLLANLRTLINDLSTAFEILDKCSKWTIATPWSLLHCLARFLSSAVVDTIKNLPLLLGELVPDTLLMVERVAENTVTCVETIIIALLSELTSIKDFLAVCAGQNTILLLQ